MSAAEIFAANDAAGAERKLAETARFDVAASIPAPSSNVAPGRRLPMGGDVVDWTGEDGAVELLDIDPADEVVDEFRDPSASSQCFDALFDAFPQPTTPPIHIPRARHSVPVAQDTPTMPSLANLETLIALSRLGLKKTPADRLEAYLAPLPVEMRERILMVVAEFGWSLDNPELVVAMLMGHIAAIGISASQAIDESASGIVRVLDEAPDMLAQALEDGRGQIAAAGGVIHQTSLNYAESIREGLRRAAMDTAAAIAEAQAVQHEGFTNRAEQETLDRLARLSDFESDAEARLKAAMVGLVHGASRAISQDAAREVRRGQARMKNSVVASWFAGGAAVGMALMALLMAR